jgi:Ca2+-binding RTX toxin-like protein
VLSPIARTRRPRRAPAAVVLWTGLLIFGIPAASSATTPSRVDSFPAVRSAPFVSILGGTSSNDIVVDLDIAQQRYLISDTAGVIPGQNCAALSSTSVQCVRLAIYGPGDGFGAVLQAGDDTLRLTGDARYGRLDGGPGADTIISGNARNVIVGDDGNDTLRGHSGNDGLFGDRGLDALHGGGGNDRLEARNLDRDRLIDCGAGRDVALIDPMRDPKPIGCEVIVRKPREH